MRRFLLMILVFIFCMITSFIFCYPFVYLLLKYNVNVILILIFMLLYTHFFTKIILEKLRDFLFFRIVKNSYSQMLKSYYDLCIIHRKRYKLYFSEFANDKENIEECSKALEKAFRFLMIQCELSISNLDENKRSEKKLIDKFKILEERCNLLLTNEACTDYIIK